MKEKDRAFERLFRWAIHTLEARRGLKVRSPSTVVRLLSVEGVRDILRLKDPEIPPDIQDSLTRFRHLNERTRLRKTEALLTPRPLQRIQDMTPKHPIREALRAVCGAEPPSFVQGWDMKGLNDQQMMELQDWCAMHARPEWATGLSMWEAAEIIVEGAVENGNIEDPRPPKPSWEPSPKYLFTLHYSGAAEIKASRIAASVEAAVAKWGGVFVPRPGGVCQSSTDASELGLCGTLRFPPEMFREMDETDTALAGSLSGNVVYTNGALGLLAHSGQTVELKVFQRVVEF